VVDFVEGTAPGLETAGFGVRLPAWCRGAGERRRLSITARSAGVSAGSPGRLTLDAVIRFDWELALGDDRLTPEELSDIAERKVPLVRVRGKWVYFSAEELRAVSQLLQDGLTDQRPMREVLQLAVCGGEVEGLPVEQVVA